jgi:hypothetical protein
VLGIVGAFLFRNVAGKLKLAAFTMITGGLLGLFIIASIQTIPEAEADRNTCADYAASALADYKRMMEIPKCQDYTTTIFFLRWQSTYQSYLSWCNSVPSSAKARNLAANSSEASK